MLLASSLPGASAIPAATLPPFHPACQVVLESEVCARIRRLKARGQVQAAEALSIALFSTLVGTKFVPKDCP